MKLNEAIELLGISEDNVPYFLEWWKDYPVYDEKFRENFIDRKLPWHFIGEYDRLVKERIKLNKKLVKNIKQEIRKRKGEAKKAFPNLSEFGISHRLHELKNEQFDWQDELRKTKYINNLEFAYHNVFCNLVNRANLGDRDDSELAILFYTGAVEVSSRLQTVIERWALKSKIQFTLPGNWREGEKLISKWLKDLIPEFNIHNIEGIESKNLKEQILKFYTYEQINDNIQNIPKFGETIHSQKTLKKANGSYYTKSAITKRLYEMLGKRT